MRTVISYLCICMLVQAVSVSSLAVFLWALLPEIKWMIMMMNVRTAASHSRRGGGAKAHFSDSCGYHPTAFVVLLSFWRHLLVYRTS